MVFQKISQEVVKEETRKLIAYTKKFYEKNGKLPIRKHFRGVEGVKNDRWIDRHIKGKIYTLYKLAGFSENQVSRSGVKKKGSNFAKELFSKEKAETEDEKRSCLIRFVWKLIDEKILDKDRVTASCFKGFDDRPSFENFKKFFGKWSNFLKVSGIKSRRRRMNMTDEEYRSYFKEDLCDYTNKSGCWMTHAYTIDNNGYKLLPNFRGGDTSRLHIASFVVFHGDIPDSKLVVMHSCDNRLCFNPDHLILGTQRQNLNTEAVKNHRSNQEKRGGNSRSFDIDPYNFSELIKLVKKNCYIVQPYNQWIWKREVRKGRYPEITLSGKRYTLARLIAANKAGKKYEDCEGEVARHILPNPSLKPDTKDCNPDHIILGTQSQNVKDFSYYRKDRKLTREDEIDIASSYRKEVKKDIYGSLLRWQEEMSQKYEISGSHATKVALERQYLFMESEDLFVGRTFEKDVFFEDVSFRVDYFLPNDKIAVDVVSLDKGSEVTGKTKDFFLKKKKSFQDIGIKYLCFYETEVRSKKFDIVQSIINFKSGMVKKIGARKCLVKSIGKNTARKFFQKNHLMGEGKGEAIGLWQGKVILAAIRITHHKDYIDIDRFCTKIGHQVYGGLSRLIKEVERRYNPAKIISYVDGRYGDGHSLSKIGFNKKSENPSFKWTDGKELKSRQYYLSNSGKDSGFSKIWDCGQMRFEKLIKEGKSSVNKNMRYFRPSKKRAKMKSRNDFEHNILTGSLEENQKILINIGLEMYEKLGRKIKAHDFRGLGLEMPTDNIIIKYFDNSWNKYVEATGIEKIERKKMRQSFVEFTNRYIEKNNKYPSNKNYIGEYNYSKLKKLFPNGGISELRSLCKKV